jgi:hypothetical protein
MILINPVGNGYITQIKFHFNAVGRQYTEDDCYVYPDIKSLQKDLPNLLKRDQEPYKPLKEVNKDDLIKATSKHLNDNMGMISDWNIGPRRGRSPLLATPATNPNLAEEDHS